jgi:hypothetical protein
LRRCLSALDTGNLKVGYHSYGYNCSDGSVIVGDHWQCRGCTHGDRDLCDDCIDSWVRELKDLNYSDDYERRLNITSGIAMMLMGLVALLVNSSMAMWEEGDLVAAVCVHFIYPC